jgi:hypothetical protein
MLITLLCDFIALGPLILRPGPLTTHPSAREVPLIGVVFDPGLTGPL